MTCAALNCNCQKFPPTLENIMDILKSDKRKELERLLSQAENWYEGDCESRILAMFDEMEREYTRWKDEWVGLRDAFEQIYKPMMEQDKQRIAELEQESENETSMMLSIADYCEGLEDRTIPDLENQIAKLTFDDEMKGREESAQILNAIYTLTLDLGQACGLLSSALPHIEYPGLAGRINDFLKSMQEKHLK